MQWHPGRQRVPADNAARSDPPNCRPRDPVEPKFDSHRAGPETAAISALAAHPKNPTACLACVITNKGKQVRHGNVPTVHATSSANAQKHCAC